MLTGSCHKTKGVLIHNIPPKPKGGSLQSFLKKTKVVMRKDGGVLTDVPTYKG
jgi:hypothetical protein